MTDPGSDYARTTHVVTRADVTTWLAGHGVSAAQIRDATIRLEASPSGLGAWADLTFYKLDHNGRRYPVGDNAAHGTMSIPLHSLPPLTLSETLGDRQ